MPRISNTYCTNLRFDSDNLVAKKNVKGNLFIYNNQFPDKDFCLLPREEVKFFIEWLNKAFMENKDEWGRTPGAEL